MCPIASAAELVVTHPSRPSHVLEWSRPEDDAHEAAGIYYASWQHGSYVAARSTGRQTAESFIVLISLGVTPAAQ
jgi:hypothetical protein